MRRKSQNLQNIDAVVDAYIGKRLKLRRVMLHMSQDELASLVGVTFQQIQKYECGNTRISASRLFAISKILQVDILFFFDGLENQSPDFLSEFQNAFGVQEEVRSFDPLRSPETIELVSAYWKLEDENKRKKILEFIVSMI